MKVKFMFSNSTYELEKLINNFIKDKELIDIKYQILKTDGFIPNPDMFPIIKHKDGNKQNNSVDNLEWYNDKQGYKKPKSVVQLDLDGNIINEFQSVGKASQITGITRDNISRVCNGIRNTAGGYKWKYKKVAK